MGNVQKVVFRHTPMVKASDPTTGLSNSGVGVVGECTGGGESAVRCGSVAGRGGVSAPICCLVHLGSRLLGVVCRLCRSLSPLLNKIFGGGVGWVMFYNFPKTTVK